MSDLGFDYKPLFISIQIKIRHPTSDIRDPILYFFIDLHLNQTQPAF
jgi:hypothetical protein